MHWSSRQAAHTWYNHKPIVASEIWHSALHDGFKDHAVDVSAHALPWQLRHSTRMTLVLIISRSVCTRALFQNNFFFNLHKPLDVYLLTTLAQKYIMTCVKRSTKHIQTYSLATYMLQTASICWEDSEHLITCLKLLQKNKKLNRAVRQFSQSSMFQCSAQWQVKK